VGLRHICLVTSALLMAQSYGCSAHEALGSDTASQQKGNKHATTLVAKVDTMLSPRPGVTPEGHCQPGTDSIPRTSQKEQQLAMQGYPWGSRKLYLQMVLARLSILILSKAYPELDIL
jgi:hypothetical protein